MADISVTVGMDKSQFDNGLREVRAQAAAASGTIGQSFAIAGARMQGIVDPLKKFNAGLASSVSAVTGLIGPIGAAVGLATAAYSALTYAGRLAEEQAQKVRAAYDDYAASVAGLNREIERMNMPEQARAAADLASSLKEAREEFVKSIPRRGLDSSGSAFLLSEFQFGADSKMLKEKQEQAFFEKNLEINNRTIEQARREQAERDKIAQARAEEQRVRDAATRETLALDAKALDIELLRAMGKEEEAKNAQIRLNAERAILEIERQSLLTTEEKAKRVATVRAIEMANLSAPVLSEASGIDQANFRSFGGGFVNSGLGSRVLGRGDSIAAETLELQRQFAATQRRIAETLPVKLQQIVDILTRQPIGARA